MISEISIFGVFVPTILIAAIAAYVATSFITQSLRMTGFYRLIWHHALFNLALFVCLAGTSLLLLSRYPL